MTAPTSVQADGNPFAGERIITEFWSIGRSNRLHELAGSMPFGLGIVIYFPLYVLNAVLLPSVIRYTLTTRRIRVDQGIRKKTIHSIPLEQIVDARLAETTRFTRTGDIELLGKDGVLYVMKAVQDPEPVRKTILDAVRARVEVAKAMASLHP